MTLEFGHWIALLCGCLVFVFSGTWGAQAGLALLGVVFLFPAMQAANIARREKLPFSWLRLYFPRNRGRGVRVTRRQIDTGHDAVIYTPPTGRGKRRCVVALHAGGWDGGDPGEFPSANREIAARCGVAIVSIGYRLAPEHRWPAQAEDTRAGIAWVRAHAEELGIDPDDIVLLGRSAGAQIATACAFGMPELRVERCIGVYGPPDMFFAREWSYPDDILKSLKLVRQYMGGDPHEAPEAYRTASATEFISERSPATLLIHGVNDSLVWVEHSRRLHAKLRVVGRSEYLELPWGDHGCDFFPGSPGGQLALAAMERFLSAGQQNMF
ncbi:MAG: alpha/beta hydrolase [Verrucomicrobiaceae bacterium]|nr:alpha/beta hydrolase [Verrucomicrobiaceae bacterium]